VEEIALAALAEASGKVVKWRRMQAALEHEIDELYANAVEEKDAARGFAVHEAQEMDLTLLELQQATEHASDPACEWIPTRGVGNLGWWKHVGGTVAAAGPLAEGRCSPKSYVEPAAGFRIFLD
jgi:hypothetical protein